ncbi:MAG TPA: protein kinase [Planctomycetota bacterium]|nr:protein kinase [Planctomycetota bacterium]HRR79913.1 protein kinase [Planctomycetota bacterium]
MKIVCGRCSAEVELPRNGESTQVRCPSCEAVFVLPSLADGEELVRPDTFPGYRVVALVGHGGMGAVYRAIQLSMDREVAIKVLLRKYAKVPRFVARFTREAEALAALSHPNIVGVIDRGCVGDRYYFVMEYVHGRTLRYLIRNGQVTVRSAVEMAIQICRALEAAHAAGVVHRDIKPGNILTQEEGGLVKVADFGIAHMVEEEPTDERPRRSRLGTAKYMAPEQRGTGEAVDARADIYGLGVTLHEMLTGELPSGSPPSAANRLVPKELDAIVERATRPDRAERFQSAAEMRQALEAALQAVKREETSATEVLSSALAEQIACPVCHQTVSAAEWACPACHTTLSEPCYRPGCEGVNRAGAEVCSRCGGHLRILERQRRAELEELLERAEAEVASGELIRAGRLLEEIEADHHAAFADLHARAKELVRRLLVARPVSPLRSFAWGLAALVAVGLVALAAWRLAKALAPPPAPQGDPRPTTTELVTTRVSVSTVVPPRPPRAVVTPREALRGYLLAVTDPAWASRAPGLRLAAACDAAQLIAPGKGEAQAQAAVALAKSLAELDRAVAPEPEALRVCTAAALDVLIDVLARELARQRAAARVRAIAAEYAVAARAASDPGRRVDLAASALHDLLVEGERQGNAAPDLPGRLLLLEASLDAVAERRVRPGAERVVRAGDLLLRHLRRDAASAAFPEILQDADGKLARAEHSQEPLVRVALALEAIVEALAARAVARGAE